MAADNGAGPRIADGTGAGSYYLQKFRLYETRSQFYMFGRNKSRTVWRVLKIDRLDPFELNISEDSTAYTQRECSELMNRIHEGNKSSGGLKFVTSCYGIAGFVKFLGPYYMLLITQRRPVGAICGHIVYAVTKSEMFVIPNFSVLSNMIDMRSENRYKKLLSAVDLTKDFFFSYSYHIMRSLQKNLSHHESGQVLYETLFVWNEFLTRGIRNHLKNTLWTVALIHGFFKQDKLSISGKDFRLTLIARRSRHYAGTRYLKRGVNEMGRVANDVETEQIVFEDIPGEIPTQITSVVQNRGSIPLFWSQETSRLNIRPDIILHKKDKTYQATRLHFENLGKRYGNPIIILNLIKSHEKKPRESILRAEFAYAIDFINKNLSEDDRLKFLHWDLNKYSRSKTINVLWLLGKVAAFALNLTGFFYCQVTPVISLEGALKWPVLQNDDVNNYSCKNQIEINRKDDVDVGVNGSQNGNMTNFDASRQENSEVNNENAENCLVKQSLYQKGVLRTNCIDCLDRTNVAQYAYGLAALGHQLHVLGFIDIPKIDRDAPLADELMSFYERMGDTLALQYGGSAAHNKIFSERRGQWKAATQSQEFFRTLQRYYSNAYMDAEKQNSIDLFLGHFEPQQGKPALWDLSTDQHYDGENERSFIKRSASDGNVLHESNSSVSLSNIGHVKHSDSAMVDRTHQVGNAMGLSDSTPEISTCEIDVAYSRCTPMMDRQERFAVSEHICFSDHGIDSSNCSNFLDLDWLSSSGTSYGEEIFESRSTSTSTPAENLSTENVTNGLTNERAAPHTNEAESSVKGKEIAEIRSSQESEFLSKFPESFVQWVMHSEAFFH